MKTQFILAASKPPKDARPPSGPLARTGMSSIILQAAVPTRISVGASSETTGDDHHSGIAFETESYIATDDSSLANRRNGPQREHPALPNTACEELIPLDK